LIILFLKWIFLSKQLSKHKSIVLASHWNNEAPLTQNLILTTKKLKTCINSGCVTRGAALPFTLKSILRQKKNYGNSKISPCKNIPNLQKNPLKETKILQDIITLELISSFNTSQNIIFQKSSYKNRPIIYYLGAKIH
jgi:hypothetical protein